MNTQSEKDVLRFHCKRILRSRLIWLMFQDADLELYAGFDAESLILDAAKAKRVLADAKAGLVWAQTTAGIFCGAGLGCKRNEAEARRWLLKAAQRRNAPAMAALGFLYLLGEKEDAEAAQEWFLKALDANCLAVLPWLANRFYEGPAFRPPELEAFAGALRAAESGQPDAQFIVGVYYREGYGTRKSEKKALSWFQKSADNGFVDAHLVLGLYYTCGRGVKRDVVRGVKHYEACADVNPIANYMLSRFYLGTLGIPTSEAKSLHHLKIAAAQKYSPAVVILGDTYLQGRWGLEPSPAKAVKYYRDAAEHGAFVTAMKRLVMCYREGLGVRKSPAKVKLWKKKIRDCGGGFGDWMDDIDATN